MSENKYIKMLVEHYQNTSNTMLNEMLSIFESLHINLKLEDAVDYIFKSFDFARLFKHKDKLLQTNVLFNSETKQFEYRFLLQKSTEYKHILYFVFKDIDDNKTYAFSDRLGDDLIIVLNYNVFVRNTIDFEKLRQTLFHELEHIFEMSICKDNILYNNSRNNVLYNLNIDREWLISASSEYDYNCICNLISIITRPEQRARINALYFAIKHNSFKTSNFESNFLNNLLTLLVKNNVDISNSIDINEHKLFFIAAIMMTNVVRDVSQLFAFYNQLRVFNDQSYNFKKILLKLILKHKKDLQFETLKEADISQREVDNFLYKEDSVKITDYLYRNIYKNYMDFQKIVYNTINKALSDGDFDFLEYNQEKLSKENNLQIHNLLHT